jgi:hypothetical protein
VDPQIKMLTRSNAWTAALLLAAGMVRADETVVLTNAAQVRALSIEEAARQLPVHLRGVFLGQTGSLDQGFVIADETEGIYLEGTVSNISRSEMVARARCEGSAPARFLPRCASASAN